MNPASSQSQFASSTHRSPVAGQTSTMHPSEDIMGYLRQYAREKPEVVALWCFGIGFVLGWKLKPW